MANLNVAHERFRDAFRVYYTERKRIHDEHVRTRSKDGPEYVGVQSWSGGEQQWLILEKAKLDKLATELKLTLEERTEIQNGVVQEVEPAENQHNIREQGASKTRARKKAQ